MSDDLDEEFDPTEKLPSGGGGKYKNLTTPGCYLLGIRQCLLHDRTPNDKLYSRYAFDVIDGPHKGESFLDRMFRTKSARKRLLYMSQACRVTDKFNPSKNEHMERAFVGRAFKSTVQIENGYASITYPENDWTEAELEVMKDWERAHKANNKKKVDKLAGGFDDGSPGDDFPVDAFGDDDDIPF